MSDEISLSFRAIDAEVTEEGIVLIHADVAEAQRAYCEGQFRGYALKLDGVRLTWLRSQKQNISDRQRSG